MVVVTKCNLSVELLRILLMVSIIIYHILYSVIVSGLSNRFFVCVDVFNWCEIFLLVLLDAALFYFVRHYSTLLFQCRNENKFIEKFLSVSGSS